jgi:peptidoglycan hydrolase-like protein with peptidoglycan-binding domain
LLRLRHGSRGARVKALQAALGLAPDPAGIFGPITRKALCERQAVTLGWADGVYSPQMDALLGFSVYAAT